MQQGSGASSARAAALVCAFLVAATALATFALDVVAHRTGLEVVGPPGWTGAWRGIVLGGVATWMLVRLGWHPVPIIFAWGALGAAASGLGAAWINASVTFWPTIPFTEPAAFLASRIGDSAVLALPVALLFFPTGRIARGVPMILTVLVGALVAFAVLVRLAAPGEVFSGEVGGLTPALRDAMGDGWSALLPVGVWESLVLLVEPATLAALVLTVMMVAGRMFGAPDEVRLQLTWVVWGAFVFAVLFVLSALALPYFLGQGVVIVGLAVLCTAIAIALAHHRLSRIDRVASWTAVYAFFAVGVIIVDVVLIALVGQLITHQLLASISTIIALIIYMPLRDRLLILASRLVNGRRGDPYGVVSSLSARLEEAVEPDDQLHHLAKSVAHAFVSPCVVVEVDRPDGSRLVSQYGYTADELLRMPLSYRGERIGTLKMAPGRRARLTAGDEQLLADLVRQAAAAVRASALSTELQSIREELVRAREDERQRLRRELHDGLGPALAGVQLRIEAARNTLDADAPAAADLLARASEDIRVAVTEIRRLAHDLRPPTLDDLGLVGAVEQLVRRLADAGEHIVDTDITVPTPVPAAVEVAAYRIVSEALLNVQRHARAQRAWVWMNHEQHALVIEISDDGAGIDAAADAGVGLLSMRERAAELGGTLEVLRRPGGGTVIRAVLPAPAPAPIAATPPYPLSEEGAGYGR
ncbi:histidine kinase [Salinibacterium sp. ZJ70]|uniref:sensor histidine kinase n=1 Tax=Salinibacterium sp. ZJ70 TaxID=2708084 RepID=UPI00141F2187|nr:histidine kinase [Salinibacterium sp. ZJ70]